MKFRLIIAIVVVLIFASVIMGTSVLNDSRSGRLPPPLIVQTTPEAYMEVNTFNLSTVSEVYSLSFCALRGGRSTNMSMDLIELKVSNGSTVGTLHFGDNTSQYILNMAGSSMFSVNVYGGYVFTDSTAITLKYMSGPIQNLTSIDLVDSATNVDISTALLSVTGNQNQTFSATSFGITPHNVSTVLECYCLDFSVKGNISMNLIELKVSNGSTVGTLHFGDNTSQYILNMAGSSMFSVNVYGGYVFTDSTAITLKYMSGPIQNLTSFNLVDIANGQVLG